MAASADFSGQVFWRIRIGIDPRAGRFVIGCLHHVIYEALGITFANMENLDQAGMRAGNGHEFLQTAKFALEWTGVIEAGALDNFNSVISADGVASQPDLSLSAAAN